MLSSTSRLGLLAGVALLIACGDWQPSPTEPEPNAPTLTASFAPSGWHRSGDVVAYAKWFSGEVCTGTTCNTASGAGGRLLAVEAADLNNNGNADLIFASDLSSWVCEGDGMGGIAACTVANGLVGVGSIHDLEAADFNNDGFADLVVGLSTNGATTGLYCQNTGSVTPAFSCTSAFPSVGPDVEVADADGDGVADRVYFARGKIFDYNGSGFTEDLQSVPLMGNVDLAVADFDGVNGLDVAYTNYGQPDRVCLNNGAGYTCSDLPNPAPGTDLSQSVEAGDVDGDGDPDLVIGTQDQYAKVCLNDGFGAFPTCNTFATPGANRDVDLAYIDGDNTLDIVMSNFIAGGNRICYGSGNGTFNCQVSSSAGGTAIDAVVFSVASPPPPPPPVVAVIEKACIASANWSSVGSWIGGVVPDSDDIAAERGPFTPSCGIAQMIIVDAAAQATLGNWIGGYTHNAGQNASGVSLKLERDVQFTGEIAIREGNLDIGARALTVDKLSNCGGNGGNCLYNGNGEGNGLQILRAGGTINAGTVYLQRNSPATFGPGDVVGDFTLACLTQRNECPGTNANWGYPSVTQGTSASDGLTVNGLFQLDTYTAQLFSILQLNWDAGLDGTTYDWTLRVPGNQVAVLTGLHSAGQLLIGAVPTGRTFNPAVNIFHDPSDGYTYVGFPTNEPPIVTAITLPAAPVSLTVQPVNVSATFTDTGGAGDEPYSCTVDYGDGQGPQGGAVAAGTMTCTGSHTYAEAGVYTVTVRVKDKHMAESNPLNSEEMIVIYDANVGMVKGSGRIDSPAGAYVANPASTGEATFGFVSEYKSGASIPTGNTRFKFKAASFKFVSEVQDWLVVNGGGSRAQFKGEGLVEGSTTPHKFMIWATDGGPGGSGDTFRIKIWLDNGGSETVVYDNQTEQALVPNNGGKLGDISIS